MVTTDFIGVYISYTCTPAYVFICDVSLEPLEQTPVYTSWPWFIYYIHVYFVRPTDPRIQIALLYMQHPWAHVKSRKEYDVNFT